MRPVWETLYSATRGSFFQSFEWNLLAATVFAGRETPYVVLAESGSGAAIIPACIRKAANPLSLLGEELFDYRDCLAAGDQAVLSAAWNKLSELDLPVEVKALRGSEVCERWQWLNPEPFCGAPMAGPGELPQAKNMYALRRLFRMGASVRLHSPPDQKLVRWLYVQKAQQPQVNLFADDLRRNFMEAAVQLASSRCEIFTLELEGAVLAALLTFLDGESRRFYTTYFDPRWARYSPGFALLCEATLRTVESGIAYDFMTGEQWYKMRLATRSVPLYRICRRRIAARKERALEGALAA